jgi:hypothetical protein
MDPRLIPLNGLLALVRGDGGWPALLGDQGFRVHLVEAPIYSEPANIRADAVIYRRHPDLVLPCECKGGRNVQERQARSYLAADVAGMRAAGTLPPELRDADSVAVQPVFVGRDELRDPLLASFDQFGLEAPPLLTVGAGVARLRGAARVEGLDDFSECHGGGLPPARFPIDAESPHEEILELVQQHLVAAQARRAELVPISLLAAAILPGLALLGRAAARDFVSRVEKVTQAYLKGEMATYFRFERTSAVEARVVVIRSPASADPRGATQQWQAEARRASRAIGRTRDPRPEGQLSIEDLAREGGLADG